MTHEHADDMFDLILANALRDAAHEHRYLDAPSEGVEPRKWLPCCECERIMRVPLNVVSTVCGDCLRKNHPDIADDADYQKGYREGYDAFGKYFLEHGRGPRSRFFCSGSTVIERRAFQEDVQVAPECLDFARGYLDGFERAISEFHE